MSASRWPVVWIVALVVGAAPVRAQLAAGPPVAAPADALAWATTGSPASADAPADTTAMEAVPATPLVVAESSPDAPASDTTETLRRRPVPLTVFGYYRGFLYGRTLTEPYPNLAPFERAYGVGDGYREPMLSLTVMGRPNGRASFGTEVFVYTPYEGREEELNTVSLNLGVNLYGRFRTEEGTFGVRAGGIHWYNLSPFTIGVFQVLDRFSIFERTPWEGVTGAGRYESYFQTGQANPGDQRWNYQAFQGLIVDGRQLPGGLEADVFWGKTQPNGGLPNAATAPDPAGPGDSPTYGGLAGDARTLPAFIAGGRLGRAFGADHHLALNTITSYRTLDSLSQDRRQYQVHTAQFRSAVGGVALSGEVGASRYESPSYTAPWGEALMVRAASPAARTGLPLEVQLYQVGRHFYNENGEIATSNHPEIQADLGGCAAPAGAGSIGGLLTPVGQLAHNRRGVNLTTGWGAGPARLAVGWGLAHELAATTSELSFVHRINGLAMSRVYNPFPANATCATQFGPLGRQYSFFRGVFERVPLTDVEPVTGLPLNRKYYHAVDLQAKLRARVLGRPAYLFYLGSFGSVNPGARALPQDDDTYLFVQYHELDAYLALTDRFVLAAYLGVEAARGGRFTELDAASGRPRDQLGTGLGLGFDWTLSPGAGLFFRHRWMDFEDRSFAVDTYAGHESTLELKIFF